jgi:hypothetical protein
MNTQTQHSYATDTKGTQESENLVSAISPSCYKVTTNVCETGHICTANVKFILGNSLFFQAFRRLCTPVKNVLVVIVWLTSEKGAWDVFPQCSVTCQIQQQVYIIYKYCCLCFIISQGVLSCGERQQIEEIGRRRQGSIGTWIVWYENMRGIMVTV